MRGFILHISGIAGKPHFWQINLDAIPTETIAQTRDQAKLPPEKKTPPVSRS